MRLIVLLFSIFIASCTNQETAKVKLEELKIDVKKVENIFLSRDSYSLQYPSDWTLDSSDIDFDIDSYFTFNSSDQSFITFFVFNTSINAKESLEEQIKAQLNKTFRNGSVEYFSKWGNSYNGYGATIKGKLMGIFKGELEAFSYSTPNLSFMAISQINESDKSKDSEGLALIKNTFKIKVK